MSSTEKLPVYDAAYFIKKFEAVLEEKWCVGDYSRGEQCCALGHCGARENPKGEDFSTPESTALADLFSEHIGRCVAIVNDGCHPKYQQPTPKQRILAALRDIQKGAAS